VTAISADEIVAVYDASAAIIGSAPRAVVYERGLWHASAGVLLRSGDGTCVYVHRRTTTKAVFPGMHDCLAGGVLAPGEDPRGAAARELAEELGVNSVALRPLASASWDGTWADKPMRCHLFAFEARWDGPVRHQPEEIADGWWWSDRELTAHLADPNWPFVPDTRVLADRLITAP
jgi:8-oxo-dGTP pyrophosphatase MutT (NUDIX family)